MSHTLALVGVAGGAGTTRVAVEVGATLARAGRSVAVVDAALDTQGLARHAEGQIDPDLTRVLVDEAGFGDALVPAWPDLDGRAALCPAHAPFERLARAKTADAARRLEATLDLAAEEFEHVIVDVPPLGTNPAVAAATAADRRALVAPASQRGRDLLPRVEGRLADVGAPADALVANCVGGTDANRLPDADHVIPNGPRDGVTPTAADPDTSFAPAVAAATASLVDADDETLGLPFESDGLLQ